MPASAPSDTGTASLIAHLKRAKEKWLADETFRNRVADDMAAALREYRLPVPEALFRVVISTYDGGPRGYDSLDVVQQRQLRGFLEREVTYMNFACQEAGRYEGCLPDYLGWRERQVARSVIARGYLGLVALHLPFTVELSDGCSVGCWFCGLSPEQFRGHREATPPHLDEWRHILRKLHSLFGQFAQRGFLYWATDPLDNPDYEVFADVFADELGRWPVTTTSLAAKDLKRTRALIEHARAKGTPSSRFSITTLKMQNKIHEYFTAGELWDVDMVPVNKGSVLGLAQAGGVLEMAEKQPQRVAQEEKKLENMPIRLQSRGWDAARQQEYAHETICCVAGFLINLVTRSVALISPVKASHLYPKGYHVLESATYSDVAQFGEIIGRMVHRYMAAELSDDSQLVVHPSVEYRAAGDGCLFQARRGYRKVFDLPSAPGLYTAIAGMLGTGGNPESVAPVAEIRRRLSSGGHDDPALVDGALAALWQAGVLVEPGWARQEAAR